MQTTTPSYSLVAFSELRLPRDSGHEAAFRLMVEQIKTCFGPILEDARQTQWFLDDSVRGLPLEQHVIAALYGGEIFVHLDKLRPVAFHCLTGVLPGRSASLEGYAIPAIRRTGAVQGFFDTILEYCFDHEDGLQLQKIKCEVAYPNRASLGLMGRNGFTQTGCSQNDWLSNGEVASRLYLELSKGDYDGQRRRKQQAGIQSLPDDAELSGATGLQADGRTGEQPAVPVVNASSIVANHVDTDGVTGRPSAPRYRIKFSR